MSFLDPFGVFDRKDPAKDANRFLDKIPAVGEKYYNPYIERGNRAGSVLEGEYGKELNPTSFLDELMKHYSLSEGAKYERDELGRGIGATAAAGGYAGTPEHQKEYGELADQIMSKDMQQYLQNALNIYGTGISGEQDLFGKGFTASGDLADLLGGNLSSKAGLAFQNDTQSNANKNALWSALAKALSTGAGAAFGGVPGAAVGSKLF